MDMATSATARGKISLAGRLGTSIPPDWAVDEAGRPTSDPESALRGSVLPFAGPKGSGLAMMIDLLTGGLLAGVTGDEIGDMYDDWTRPQRVSHVFLAIDPDAFLGRDAYLRLVAGFVHRVHGLPPAEGFDQVLLPGEVEETARRSAERDGVLLADTVVRDLEALSRELGDPADLPAVVLPSPSNGAC